MHTENENPKFISLSEVSKGIPYSQEYLSLLVRKGKIPAKKIGRNWCTTKEAVDGYLKRQQQNLVQELEKKNGALPVPLEIPKKVESEFRPPPSANSNLFSKILPTIIWNSSLVLSTLVVFLFLGLFVSNFFHRTGGIGRHCGRG